MAKPAQRGATLAKPPTKPNTDLDTSANEICPVCKSSRYLNPTMRFLVNPECYHKMCASCVDRIFAGGPANCPVAGCPRTLRKHRFRPQTFEDIRVEKEVDVRRTVGAVMNKREDEFETLRDYNNYLEEVEEMTFNMINEIDVARTEKKLDAYREINNASIRANANLARDELAGLKARQAAEREQAKMRREAARREIEEERMQREQDERMMLDKLAGAREGEAEKIVKHGERIRLKRAGQRRKQSEAASRAALGTGAGEKGDAFVIRGLKKPQAKQPEVEAAYDPFGGVTFEREYFALRDQYDWEVVNRPRNDMLVSAGGYDLNGYCERVLCDGFAGLGVVIGDEMVPERETIAG